MQIENFLAIVLSFISLIGLGTGYYVRGINDTVETQLKMQSDKNVTDNGPTGLAFESVNRLDSLPLNLTDMWDDYLFSDEQELPNAFATKELEKIDKWFAEHPTETFYDSGEIYEDINSDEIDSVHDHQDDPTTSFNSKK